MADLDSIALLRAELIAMALQGPEQGRDDSTALRLGNALSDRALEGDPLAAEALRHLDELGRVLDRIVPADSRHPTRGIWPLLLVVVEGLYRESVRRQPLEQAIVALLALYPHGIGANRIAAEIDATSDAVVRDALKRLHTRGVLEISHWRRTVLWRLKGQEVSRG